MNRIAKPLFVILAASLLCPTAASALAQDRPEPKPLEPDPCLELESGSPASEALRMLRLSSNGTDRPIVAIRITGLHSIDEAKLWRLVGRLPEPPIPMEQVAAAVARVAETGLFAQVIPSVDVTSDPRGAVVEIQVLELPRVERIIIDGLTEVRPEEILDAILESRPPEDGDEDGKEEGEDEKAARGRSVTRCPAPVPPKQLVARARDGQVVPGIVWGGLPLALGRAVEHLYDQGYLMADLHAELTPDGVLRVHVDEGRLAAVEIRGLPPELERQVRATLGLLPGRVFVLADVRNAVHRAEERFPFLRAADGDHEAMPKREVVERVEPDGRRVYELREAHGSHAARGGSIRIEGNTLTWDFHGKRRGTGLRIGDIEIPVPVHFDEDVPDYVSVTDHKVAITFREQTTKIDNDWVELLRHTPVTGWAPGVDLTGMLWDPDGRVHLGADAAFNLNLASPADPVDYLVGPKLQIPALGIAELGGQVYSLTDSSDRWRASRIDSYLYSMTVNLPDADYYRRTGFDAFLTFQILQQLTLGAEYRRDEYRSLPTVVGVGLFNRAPWPNLPINEGLMGSAIGRIEWSTEKAPLAKVRSRHRDPETSLVARDWYGELEPGFQTVNTVEVADPALGGGFRFVRLVSDNSLHIRTGGDHGLRIRFRLAGGDNLPAQKREGLGGWGSLRGYMFKEFQGDASALVMAEYHLGFFSGFVDGGTVRNAGAWMAPKVDIGAALNFGSHFQIAAAWRTDANARLMPEVKAVLGRTF